MDYLIWQMGLCLGVALLLGAVLGWFFRGGCQHKLVKVVGDWSQRFAFIEKERDRLALKVQDRDKLSHENKSLLSRLRAMENGANLASNVLKDNKEKLDTAEHDLSEIELLLEQRNLAIAELKDDLGVMKEREGLIKKRLLLSEELNFGSENKTAEYKAKLNKLSEELQASDKTQQSNLNEIAALQALLEVYEEGGDDLLEKENQLQKALSNAEVLNKKHEKQTKKYNIKIEKLMDDLKSSKEKEQVSEDEIKMILALLKVHETGNDDFLEKDN